MPGSNHDGQLGHPGPSGQSPEETGLPRTVAAFSQVSPCMLIDEPATLR
ncbi:hypothetical protein IM511_11630 [Erythrobacteraceae bacterium E2-1 Yellow Sea]|nr:hypothetical protein [Erythrobacteraceae bacterium E2-1 Yellow Sea]